MTRKRKELIWTTFALAGIGLGAFVASTAQGEDTDKPLKGPQVKQGDGERRGPRGDGQMKRDGERPQRGEARPGGDLRRLLEGVGLTDEQKEKVRTIHQEHAEKAKAFREEHRAEMEQLRQDMHAAREAGDRDKMRELGQKHRALMDKAPRGQVTEQIKGVLTPEQLKTFEANQAKERERLHNREGQRPRGDGNAEQRRRPQRDGQERPDAPPRDKLEI